MGNLKHTGDIILDGNINITGGTITIDGNPIGGSDEWTGGTNYILVKAEGTDTENTTELLTAYNLAVSASTVMSASSDNRITIIAAPGNYNFDSAFVMDTQFIDLVSLDGNRSIIFNGTGTISITANDVFVKGVDVQNKNFTIGDDLDLLKVENCKGGNNSFASDNVASGTFINCEGGDGSFGGFSGIASGTFNNCQGGFRSFGGLIASGTFTNCQGKNNSFGGMGGAVGIFTNCQGGEESFGAFATASGTFIECMGLFGSFGTGGQASGWFHRCMGDDATFGSFGVASGIFIDCIGGGGSFGGDFGGTLSGKLYYCRLTSGPFETLTSPGILRACIDGNDQFIASLDA